jgi:hypothetical protein
MILFSLSMFIGPRPPPRGAGRIHMAANPAPARRAGVEARRRTPQPSAARVRHEVTFSASRHVGRRASRQRRHEALAEGRTDSPASYALTLRSRPPPEARPAVKEAGFIDHQRLYRGALAITR